MTARLRGFNLVEMTILLVVVGLVSAAALAPVFNLNQNEIYERETDRMHTIRAAIFGYAVRHRTRAGATAEVSDAGENVRTFALPGGRPFLPCPDITGDGHEDRADADYTGFSAFAATVTTFILTDSATAAAVRDFRRCRSPRGVLPWRTLGVPPADHWGNLYTYYVDDVFADAQTGFNENTAPDIYDPRTAVSAIVAGGAELYAPRDFPPLAICGGTDDCFGGASVALTLAAGRQTGESFNSLFREFAAFDVAEGVPFAVVSHGENGAGAAKYEVNVVSRPAAAVADALICGAPITGTAGAPVNITGPLPEAFNFPFVSLITGNAVMCASPQINAVAVPEGFMISGIPRGDIFDDIVVWAARDDLLDAMHRGGALPAPDFPALRPY